MRSRYGRTLIVVVAMLATVTLRPHAQTPAPKGAAPFDIIGFIDAATMTPGGDSFSGGGTVTVNGTEIIVPKNTLLQMPAFALTWEELFNMAPAPYGLASGPDGEPQSGLAKSDVPAPAMTYELHVQGNRVINDSGVEEYRAGLMFISQQSLNSGAGVINYIDYAKGELRVGGTVGDATTGARVIINDPQGKFAPMHSTDPRFTIDEDNPTVRSETGYPMCIPRLGAAEGDDHCPQTNRPRGSDGNYLTVFTTDVPPGWEFMTPADYQPNGASALVFAPFEVGDFVTYSGNLVAEKDGGEYIEASTVVANVGIFTQPGTQPTYVAIDVMILGVAGTPVPFLPQEATVRTRIEGFTTDPSSFVMLSALDVDPCNGQITERFYDMVAVDPGAPTGAVAGRWRWRPNSEGAFLPPTRMLKATSINGQYFDWNTGDSRTPAGLEAGIYAAPNFEFLFAENLGIGNPPVPSNFHEFPFLANGSGAYYGAIAGETPLGRLGQLDPWPGAAAPAGPSCPNGTDSPAVFTPIADAGPSVSVTRGSTITLDGSGSRDTTTPSPMPLTYTWSQTDASGKDLAANDVTHRIQLPGATAPFGTPQDLPRMTFRLDKLVNGQNIPDESLLTFRLDVSNCSPWSDPGSCGTSSALMTVKVTKNPTATDTLTAVTAIWRVKRSRLDVNATTSDPNSILEVAGFGVMGPALPIATGVPAPAGDRSYTQIGVNPPPTEITVRSSLGAFVTVPVTVRP
jgi:hypothetical protein